MGLIVIALSLASSTAAQCADPAISAVMIRTIDADYRQAWIRRDVAAMSAVMSDDWTVTHANGRQQTKAQFLSAIGLGRVRFLASALSDETIRVYDGSAVLTARAHNRISVGDHESEGDVRLIAVYACSLGTWRVVAEQATAIEESAPSK